MQGKPTGYMGKKKYIKNKQTNTKKHCDENLILKWVTQRGCGIAIIEDF